MLESLQQEVRDLQRENIKLRMDIQVGLPRTHREILAGIGTPNVLFAQEGEDDDDGDGESGSGDEDGNSAKGSATKKLKGEKGSTEKGEKGELGEEEKEKEKEKERVKVTKISSQDYQLLHALSACQQNFVLSDPTLPDNPIVFASPGFYDLTGYKPTEVLGRNCRFLQGVRTDPKAVEVIRSAIATGTDASVCMLNYKNDNTPFWNQFFIAALRNEDNVIVNYMGVQCPVREGGGEGVEEKVNERMPLKREGQGAGG